MSEMPPINTAKSNDFQTPPEALTPLLPFLKKEWIIWECAEGDGRLSHCLFDLGYRVLGSELLVREKHKHLCGVEHYSGKNFLNWDPVNFDCIITNPPYSIMNKFIERCYHLEKPFALLMPLMALETQTRQNFYRKYGIEIILFPKRIHFKTPDGKGHGPWFSTAWFTHGLDIGKELLFSEERNAGV